MAVDFDFSSAKIQAWQTSANARRTQEALEAHDTAPFHTHANKRLLSLPETPGDLGYDQFRAYNASKNDEPYEQKKTGCWCGLFKSYGPSGRIIELVICFLSSLCLLGTFLAFVYAGTAKREHGTNPRLTKVRMSKEVLLFTNEMAMVHAMRHMQTEYNGFCKNKFKIDLQVPTWNQSNAKDFYGGKNSTMYGMSTSVHAGSVSLFAVVFFIYIFSVIFQGTRFWQYCTKSNKEGLYKPWLGPDFSRWLEYLFTWERGGGVTRCGGVGGGGRGCDEMRRGWGGGRGCDEMRSRQGIARPLHSIS